MNYNLLNINERTVISLLASSDVSIREIAKQLGRSPSTISRELKRNQTNERDSRYIPSKAQETYQNRKHHCGRKYISYEDTLSYVKSRIEDIGRLNKSQIEKQHTKFLLHQRSIE